MFFCAFFFFFFFFLVFYFLVYLIILINISIMLAYASIYEITYYARNYAGIIHQPLVGVKFQYNRYVRNFILSVIVLGGWISFT